MRRIACLSLGLALAATLGAAPPDDATAGDHAYTILGEMAVQHSGRVKPLDTFARLTVKQVYTRETIKLLDPDGKVRETWEPLAALIDWRARPEFWDKQEIIAFEYLPLKQRLLAVPAHEALARLAKSGLLSEADRAKVEQAAKDPNVSAGDLKAASKLAAQDKPLAAELATLAHKIGPDQKWLSPDDLEAGRLIVDGREVAFTDWVATLDSRPSARPEFQEEPKYSPIEKKAIEGAQKLMIYMGFRDGNPRGAPALDLYAIPRPHSAAYMKFTSAAVDRIREHETKGHEAMGADHQETTALEGDALRALQTYWEDLKKRDRKVPGEDADADAAYAEWLRDKSSWVPLRLILTSDLAELGRAGFDEAKVSALRSAYDGLIAAEKASPAHLPEAAARAVVAAARDLGESVSVPFLLTKDTGHATWADLDASKLAAFKAVRDPLASSSAPPKPEQIEELLSSARDLSASMVPYPSRAAIARETTFNRLAPFYQAQSAYGLALVLLLVSLGFSRPAGVQRGTLEKGLYGLGMLALMAGIALEVVGFYFRIRISGWAPVTNMYETVIWVALVTSSLGLVLELIYRKTYAATAASGVALLATVLAANVSLLDPDIKNLQPVLRSNYWLTIHVLTIVSSYAAFALAMGLGLLATGYYLSATYKRDVPYGKLALPFLPGVPMMAVGIGGLIVRASQAAPDSPTTMPEYGLGLLALLGMGFNVMGVFGLIGEAAARASARAQALGLGLLGVGIAGVFASRSIATPAWWPANVSLAAAPTIVAGLGLVTVILSRMGAMARAAMVASEAPHADDFGRGTGLADTFSAASGGAVATVARKPTVAEIRARQQASTLTLDPRRESMQATANRIKPLSNFTYRAMQVGVLLVAAGTILGGVWADVSWGRFWGWDAKEVWALITLLVYLVPLHGRFAGWVNTFGLIASSVVCFASVMMAWYGVNFVLSTGLHTYGFAEGGGQGVVLAACFAVLAVVLATGYRRRLASMA